MTIMYIHAYESFHSHSVMSVYEEMVYPSTGVFQAFTFLNHHGNQALLQMITVDHRRDGLKEEKCCISQGSYEISSSVMRFSAAKSKWVVAIYIGTVPTPFISLF